MELENIKRNTTWNDASESINSNFSKIRQELLLLGNKEGLTEVELEEFLTLHGYTKEDWVLAQNALLEERIENLEQEGGAVNVKGSEFVNVDEDGTISLEIDPQGGLGATEQGLGIVDIPSHLLEGINIDVDSSMSDTSENAVANKVIKKYVDEQVNGLEASVNQTFVDVETSIEQLDNAVSELIATKAGAFHLDPSTNMFTVFTTVEAMNEYLAGGTAKENILFQKILQGGGGGASSNSYAMKVTIPESQYNYTTASEKMMITATFESTVKYAGNDNYEPYEDDALFTVEVFKAGSDASKIVATNILVPYGGQFSFDLKPYLGNGSNIIKLTAIGFVSGATAVARTTVSVTTMSLAPFGFEWYKPFVEGSDYTVSLRVLGSLSKTLYVQIGDNAPVTTSLGTNQYDVIPLDHKLTASEHPSVSGVYELKMWLKADVSGVTSEVLKYNIMCVASEDVATRRLVCINEVAAEVDNYAEGQLFTYATYNGRSSKATPTLSITKGSETITSNTIEVDTGVPYDFSYAFSLAMTESSAAIVAKAVFGNTQSAQITLKNETAFAPVSGYSFYMDAASRSNEDEHRESFVNEVDGSRIAATWTDMAWVNGMDGWTTDENGNKCLLIPAMSKALVDFAPMKSIASAMTLEMQFKVKNVSDFDEDIITIASQATASWMGVKVKPTNVTMHSRSLFTDDLKQGYNLKDEEMVHLVLCVNNNFMQTGNVVIIYVNGVKKCTFEWSRGDSFNHEGKLELGSQTADLYLYKIRLYEKQFEWAQIRQNFISCLPTAAEKSQTKRKEDSVVTDTSIDFDKVYGKYNTFIVELPSGAELPNRKNNPSNIPIEGTNLYIDIVQDPSCTIQGEFLNVPLEGQGTTAMTYYRWNLRSKTDTIRITAKKNVASSMHSHKAGATRLFNDLNRAVVGANEADGRVAVYQYPVYGFLKIENEDHAGTYYYEFIGLYTIGPDKGDKPTFGYNNKTYKSTLIHMEGTDHDKVGVGMDYPWEQMTVGLNVKGDAFIGPKNSLGQLGDESWEIGACGGFEDPAEMKAYLDVEFAPAYKLDYECTPLIYGLPSGITIADVNANIKEFRELETDTAFTCAACLIYIDGEYDTYYYNVVSGTYVKDGRKVYDGLTSAHGFSTSTLANKGDVLAKNAYIRECRKARYRAEMGQYWHLNDSIFHACFLDLIGATDNEKKNSYPYKFGTLASGSRWRWRQDDLDTIFDVNNQGSADKSYSIMNTDKQGTTMIFKGNTSYHWRCVREYYKEEMKTMMQTVFAQMIAMSPYGTSDIQKLVGCIRHYFWDYAQEYFTGGAYNLDAKWTYEDTWRLYTSDKTINAVNPLGQSLGSHYEAEKAWVTLRMLFLASMYESAAFVNYVDSSEGQISFRQGGDFTFKLTPAIDLRPSVLQGQSQTGAKFADGRIMAGDTATINTVADDSADTMVYVQGADWLADAGDFSKVRIGSSDKTFAVSSKRLQRIKVGDATASNVTTNIGSLDVGSCPSVEEIEARNISTLQGEVDLTKCPRLRRAYFGGTSLTGITLPDGSKIQEYGLPSTIQRLKLRQLPLLGNTKIPFDLKPNWITGGYINMNDDSVENIVSASNWRYCDYLNISGLSSIFISDIFHVNTGIAFYDYEKKRISYFTSTKLGVGDGEQGYDIEVVVPNGAVYMRMDSRLDAVHKLYSYKYKDGLIYDSLNALNYLWVEGNKRLDGYDLLKTAFDGGSPLNNIRVIGFYKDGDASDVAFLATLANGNYHGIDSNGYNDDNRLPNLEGTVNVNGNIYQEDADFIVQAYEGSVVINALGFYLKFADPEVLRVLLANGVGDGLGITTQQAAEQTTIGAWFVNNTDIVSFDEFSYFSGIKQLDLASSYVGGFQGCSNLKSIKLPTTMVTIPDGSIHGQYASTGAFKYCSSLENVGNMEQITYVGRCAFFKCTSLKKAILPLATYIGDQTFYNCSSLEEIDITNAEIIGRNAFEGCNNLTTPINLNKAVSISWGAFPKVPVNIVLNSPLLETLGGSNYDIGIFNGSGLTEIATTGKVSAIPSHAGTPYGFAANCLNLTTVNLEDLVVSVGAHAFDSCSSLSNLKLSKNVGTIHYFAFANCTSLAKDLTGELQELTYLGYAAFANTKVCGEVSLPKLATMPNSGYSRGAFYKTDITKVLNLGELTAIPNGNGTPYGAFAECAKLTLFKMSSKITSIGQGALANCSALEAIVCEATTVPTLVNTNAFTNTNNCPIYVPDASMEEYKNTTNWNAANIAPRIYPMSIYNMGGLENVIVFADPAVASVLNANGIGSGGYVSKQQAAEVTSLGTMFRDNAEIVSFDELQYFTGLGMIGDPSYETMWTAAFYSCENLEHITLPPNLTAIQGLTFSLCPKLKIDSLPQSITRISFEAFSGADLDGLVINLPNLSSLGDNAFAETNISRVENLGNIEKSGPTSGNELYNGTFRACKKLTFARLPSTLNALGISLFRDCTALETVICESTIPPTLYYGEFTGCTSLKSIYVPDAAVDTYKAASGWSNASIVNLIKPMSQYNG